MSLFWFVVLAVLFAPVYITSWLAYAGYNFGILAVFPTLVMITQPQMFLILIFIFTIGSVIQWLIRGKGSDATVTSLIDPVK